MSSTRHHLAEVIGKRSLHLKNRRQLARQIAAYLLETNQTAQLESLLRDVMAYRAEHGVVEVTAVSAHQLTADIKRQIQALIKAEYPGTKVTQLNEEIDPAVIGGLRLEMPGEQLDTTVDAKLNLFKRLTAEETN